MFKKVVGTAHQALRTWNSLKIILIVYNGMPSYFDFSEQKNEEEIVYLGDYQNSEILHMIIV